MRGLGWPWLLALPRVTGHLGELLSFDVLRHRLILPLSLKAAFLASGARPTSRAPVKDSALALNDRIRDILRRHLSLIHI